MEHPDPGASKGAPEGPPVVRRNHHAKRAFGAPTCSRAVQTYLMTVTYNPLRTVPRGAAERRLPFAAHRAPVPAGRSAAASGQCRWRRPHGDKKFASFDTTTAQERSKPRPAPRPRGGRLGNPLRSGRRFTSRWRNPGGPVLPVGTPPSRALSAGCLAALGAHPGSTTGWYGT